MSWLRKLPDPQAPAGRCPSDRTAGRAVRRGRPATVDHRAFTRHSGRGRRAGLYAGKDHRQTGRDRTTTPVDVVAQFGEDPLTTLATPLRSTGTRVRRALGACALLTAMVAAALVGPPAVSTRLAEPAQAAVHTSCTMTRCADARTGDATGHVLRGHQGPVVALSWRGTVLASAGVDQKVLLWDTPDGKQLQTLTPGTSVRALAR